MNQPVELRLEVENLGRENELGKPLLSSTDGSCCANGGVVGSLALPDENADADAEEKADEPDEFKALACCCCCCCC